MSIKDDSIGADKALETYPHYRYGKGSQKLVYVLLLALGVVLILLGAYCRHLAAQTWIPELAIAMGVAMAAPAIVSYLYRKYMLEEITIELQKPAQEFKREASRMVAEGVKDIAECYRREISLLRELEEAGINGVYISRAKGVRAFMPHIEDEKDEILMISSSLRGLLQEVGVEYESARKALQDKMKAGVRLRILLTHPRIADLRARQEGREFGDIGKEILKSLRTLLKDWGVPSADIKLYVGTPTCFGIKTSRAMLLNAYPYMKEAFASPCVIVREGGYYYEHFYSSHFRAWTSGMALPLPDPIDVLERNLDAYADYVRPLVERKDQQDMSRPTINGTAVPP